MKTNPYHHRLFRFLLAGLPAFVLAVLLNRFLLHRCGLNASLAYAIVLAMQMTINFWICRLFVFDAAKGGGVWKSLLIFAHGNLLFRLMDWLVYVLLTTCAGVPYLLAQLFNVALFACLKYEFARRVFEREKSKAPADTKPTQ